MLLTRLLGRPLRLAAGLALAAGLSGLTASQSAHAQPTVTYTVNTFADTHDVGPGDGVCNDFQGRCSLRAALEEANSDPSNVTYNIAVPAGTYQENPALSENGCTGSAGTLCLNNTTINVTGSGANNTVVSGNGCGAANGGNRVFDVYGIGSLTNLSITNGCAAQGGGVFVETSATLNNDTVTRNNASQGAGIWVDLNCTAAGTTVEYTTISQNLAGTFSNAQGTAITSPGDGGGIFNNCGNLVTRHVNFTHNVASEYGGAMDDNANSSANYNDYLQYNAAYEGGAVYETFSGQGPDTFGDSWANSQFSFNTALDFGGAVSANASQDSVRTTHFSNNAATYAGAVYDHSFSSSYSFDTFSRNTAGCSNGAAAPPPGTLTRPTHTAAPAGAVRSPHLAVAATTPPPAGVPLALVPCPTAGHTNDLGGPRTGIGGGIFASSDNEELANDHLTGNSALGPNAYGGGLYNADSIAGIYDHFTYNTAGGGAANKTGNGGGGIWNENYVNLDQSQVQGNNTNAVGGGIYDDSGSDGQFTFTNGAITGNRALVRAGGIYSNAYPNLSNTGVGGNYAPRCPNEQLNATTVCQ